MEMNSLPDEVLRVVLKKGYLEDIVSKELVSTRFQMLISVELGLKTKFESKIRFPYGELSSECGWNTIKKLSNIRSDKNGNFGIELFMDETKFLANCIPNMCKFCFTGHALQYIEAKKKLEPSYTAENVEVVFHENSCRYVGGNYATELLRKYPDLKLKVKYPDETEPRFDPLLYYEIHLSNIQYKPRCVYENMKKVTIDSNYENISVLKLFSNMESLTIRSEDGTNTDLLKYAPYIGPNVRKLSFQIRKWRPENTPILCNLMSNYDIESIDASYIAGFPGKEILRLIIDSTWTKVKRLNIGWLNIKDKTLQIHNDEMFDRMELIRDILIRFPRLRKLCVFYSSLDEYDEMPYRNLCDDVELINRKRKIIITEDQRLQCCSRV